MSLEGKIALVTGASRGIGASIAKQLARAGARVFGTATTDAGAAVISAYLSAEKMQGQGMVLDVCDETSIASVLEAIQAQVGTVELLINNAGITRDNLMLRMKEEEWSAVINTNLSSVFRLSKACVRGMIKARQGRIVNITSIVGHTGNPGQVNYAAAKAGIMGFTKSLAQEIATRNVTVNAVAPGFIDTDMTRALPEAQREALLKIIPMQRLGEPEDIANAVLFLCSDKANYITGQTLHVNGGMFMG